MALPREMFRGNSRVHAMLRGFDWAATSFGPPSLWAESLRAIVSLMLDCPVPMCLAWGPELRLLYNDAFLAIAAERHPAALDAPMRQVWSELWPAMDPIVQRIFSGERGVSEELPVEVGPDGRAGRRSFALSFAPVHDDENRVAGLMCIGAETTGRIQMERYHAFQLRLSDALRGLSDPDEMTAHAARLLGVHLGLSRVAYLDVHEHSKTVSARPGWTNGRLPALVGSLMSMHDFGAGAIDRLRQGRKLKVSDRAGEAPDALPAYGATGARAMLALPLFKNGELRAILYAQSAEPHPWTEDEIEMAEAAAERTLDAVELAIADQRRRLAERELQRDAASKAFQLELSDLLRPLTDADEIVAAASGLLGRHLGVSRVLYAEVDEASGRFEVRRDWTGPGVDSVAGRVSRLDDFGPRIIAALRSGETVAVRDIAQDPRTAPHANAYAALAVRSFLTVPLVKSGRLDTVLILHRAEPFDWTEPDLQRAQAMAERTWSCIDAARAQASLRSERDRSQYILNSMTEGFALLDRDCTLLQINAEGLRLGQLSRAEAIGRKAGDIWPKAVSSPLGELYRDVKRSEHPGALEYKRTLPDGRPGWIEVRAVPALGGGLAVFYRDISQRKLAEEKLKETDRLKDEFVATLAHELRNPIAPIAAAAQILSLPGLNAEDVKRAGDVISRQVGYMSDLVDDLLDISRITTGRVKLHHSDLDINEIVPAALEQAEPLIKSQGHHLQVEPARVPARVWGDRHRLVQVLANLLSNAAKYTPPGGRILVRVETQEDRVELVVRDNGIGMLPEMLASAFELFSQAEHLPEHARGGLGIGLALVKGVVELHGGTVSAHSAGSGLGSEFRVSLPRLRTG